MRRVFSRPCFVLFAAIIGLMMYAGIVWAPEWNIIVTIGLNPYASPVSDVASLGSLLFTSLFQLNATYTPYAIVLSIATGACAAMLLFFYRMNKLMPSAWHASLGAAGMIAGILGFGCAACGSLFASLLLSSVLGTGFIAAMPLGGMEFQIIGFGFLLLSIFGLARAINKPPVCPI